MNHGFRTTERASLLLIMAVAACASLPPANHNLQDAHRQYSEASSDPVVADHASLELKVASDALDRADRASANRDDQDEVSHLAYVASQRVAIARSVGAQRIAEQKVAQADGQRNEIRLQARTQEVNQARDAAAIARSDAVQSDLVAGAAVAGAAASRQDAQTAQAATDMANQRSENALQGTRDAQAQNAKLQSELEALNAKKTDHGMVITMGDVLFDTDHAHIKSGAMRNVEKLAGFLRDYPMRTAEIDGFTDSVGGEAHNLELSDRRADSVRTALVSMGIDASRLTTHGYGEAYPVAGNQNAGSRQLNRRVEVILSDDAGKILPR